MKNFLSIAITKCVPLQYGKMSRGFLLGLLSIGLLFCCEPENRYSTNCLDCISFQPDSADLIIHVTLNTENDSIPIIVFEGPYEEAKINWVDTVTNEEFYLYARIGQEYTVRAEYKKDEDIIYAFDADIMNISDHGSECGDPCYIVVGGIYDLALLE